MNSQPRQFDAEVLFEFTAVNDSGEPRTVCSGYRPTYRVLESYFTSTNHEFLGTPSVSTGDKARARIWFITPEVYPKCLWIGRVLEVTEGSRVVGTATVLHIVNKLLLKDEPNALRSTGRNKAGA